jgi:hypothetical protein
MLNSGSAERLVSRLKRLAEFEISVLVPHHKLIQGGKEATDLDSWHWPLKAEAFHSSCLRVC